MYRVDARGLCKEYGNWKWIMGFNILQYIINNLILFNFYNINNTILFNFVYFDKPLHLYAHGRPSANLL